MDKFGKIRRQHWNERLKISKVAKFECDLLKTNEDTAPQSGAKFQIWMVVVMVVVVVGAWGAGGGWVVGEQNCPPPYKRL